MLIEVVSLPNPKKLVDFSKKKKTAGEERSRSSAETARCSCRNTNKLSESARRCEAGPRSCHDEEVKFQWIHSSYTPVN